MSDISIKLLNQPEAILTIKDGDLATTEIVTDEAIWHRVYNTIQDLKKTAKDNQKVKYLKSIQNLINITKDSDDSNEGQAPSQAV